jgi:hypothetical protein
VDACLLIGVLSSPSGAVTSVLVPPSALWTGEGWPSLRGRRGKPQGSTWLVRFKQRVQGERNDSASPSVSFLDISPAKAGRESRAPWCRHLGSGSSLTQWGTPVPSLRGGGGRTIPIRASSSYFVSPLSFVLCPLSFVLCPLCSVFCVLRSG